MVETFRRSGCMSGEEMCMRAEYARGGLGYILCVKGGQYKKRWIYKRAQINKSADLASYNAKKFPRVIFK